jgi:outer membrane protein W
MEGACCDGFSSRSGGILATEHAVITSWEVPVLLKWYTSGDVLRAYFGGGLAGRRTSGASNFVGTQFGPLFPPPQPQTPIEFTGGSSDLKFRSSVGAATSVGIDFRFDTFRIAPELRYTRWANSAVVSERTFESNRNVLDFVIGISFAIPKRVGN